MGGAGGRSKSVGRGVGIAGTVLAGISLLSTLGSIKQSEQSGEISASEAKQQRGGAAGSAAGSVVGWLGGAKAGAAMGAKLGVLGGPKGIAIGALIGSIAGGLAGSSLLGGIGETIGENIMGNDVVSRPGYGERTLVTPTGNIALNNQDNVVAYADDMIARNTGIDLLSKGAITSNMDNPAPIVNVDNRDLKAAIVDLRKAISSLEVRMDGDIVGRVVAKSEARSMVGVGFSVARG